MLPVLSPFAAFCSCTITTTTSSSHRRRLRPVRGFCVVPLLHSLSLTLSTSTQAREPASLHKQAQAHSLVRVQTDEFTFTLPQPATSHTESFAESNLLPCALHVAAEEAEEAAAADLPLAPASHTGSVGLLLIGDAIFAHTAQCCVCARGGGKAQRRREEDEELS